MFELVVAKPADGFIAAPGLQEFQDIPGPDEFNVVPGRGCVIYRNRDQDGGKRAATAHEAYAAKLPRVTRQEEAGEPPTSIPHGAATRGSDRRSGRALAPPIG